MSDLATVIVVGWGDLLNYPKFFQEIDKGSPSFEYWLKDGPVLPLEYSHKCDDGGLSLVVDHANGVATKTHFWKTKKSEYVVLVKNLTIRELNRVVMNAKSNLRNILFHMAHIVTSDTENKVLQVLEETLTNPDVRISTFFY